MFSGRIRTERPRLAGDLLPLYKPSPEKVTFIVDERHFSSMKNHIWNKERGYKARQQWYTGLARA
jgi:hypothetical protein